MRIYIIAIWVWVNTYRYIFSGMNIHLPAILGFTRYQGFDPSPYRLEIPHNGYLNPRWHDHPPEYRGRAKEPSHAKAASGRAAGRLTGNFLLPLLVNMWVIVGLSEKKGNTETPPNFISMLIIHG